MTGAFALPPETGEFQHPALFYRALDAYVRETAGFVRDALKVEEPVLVAVPQPRLDALRQALGTDAAAVSFADMTELGRNPGRVLSALGSFADRHPGRPARIVGESIWPGRPPAETVEAVRHEALVNTAFRGRRATVLCPYDIEALPPAVIADARRTHPALIEDGRARTSSAYTDPAAVCAGLDLPLPEPAAAEVRLAYAGGQLRQVRERADAWVRGTALAPHRRGDFVIAVNEAAANSLAHGGGSGTLRLWRTGSGTAVAEIRDGGRLTDLLAGRHCPPLASSRGGRGLWMIHQLCDLVELRTDTAGLTLRLHMRTQDA
ncbi:sensor histidine kinase [Streptomyces sp. NBC_00083]|uniref:sensor histidine kinase n=1 Tax=Streptomyces sp. NBC_00083 TaxID=2975647 RepID=UPI0022588D70|nr:sensor histidine kinase [Streptomyces sp. NBC_00083]MCX5387187.1 sensor histidine kinase [Streptomyces sp. NBC_00083]